MECQQTYRDMDQNGEDNDEVKVIKQSGGEFLKDQY